MAHLPREFFPEDAIERIKLPTTYSRRPVLCNQKDRSGLKFILPELRMTGRDDGDA
jgi:hypothetical protein